MTEKYAELRAAIEAGPTPGPWWIGCGAQQRHQVVADRDGAPYVILEGNANFVSDAHRNAAYVAAADPGTIRALLAERDALWASVLAIDSLRSPFMSDDDVASVWKLVDAARAAGGGK